MRPALVLAACLSASVLSAQAPDAVDPGLIPNYKLISPGIAAAGQPSAEALPKLAAMGFKTVVNLRMPAEDGPANEGALVAGQGLRYVTVPMTAASFSLADVEAVEKVLNDPAARPVLLHCASANRVGATWAAVLARRGQSLDDALAKGHDAGLRPGPMEDAVKRVLAAPAH